MKKRFTELLFVNVIGIALFVCALYNETMFNDSTYIEAITDFVVKVTSLDYDMCTIVSLTVYGSVVSTVWIATYSVIMTIAENAVNWILSIIYEEESEEKTDESEVKATFIEVDD